MDFSLAENPLQNYISISHNHPTSSSDSLRSLQTLESLNQYFHEFKHSISSTFNQLWTRIQQCNTKCQQLSSRIDISYSRITAEEKGIDIERYEDLLPVSFKEVEWTKSSRVNIQEDEERVRLVQKYEKQMEGRECDLKTVQQKQTNTISEAQQSFMDRVQEYQKILNHQQAKSEAIFRVLQSKLSALDLELSEEVTFLDNNLEKMYLGLTTLIDVKIKDIEQEMAMLGK